MTDVVPTAAPSPPTGGIVRLLRARLAWIVAVTALVTSSAAAFSMLQTPIYESTARVVVLPEVKSAGPAPQPPSMGTEKELVASEVVASPAARNLGVGVAELLDGVQVGVPVDTQVLEITYSSDRPAEARRRAQALANAYVAYKDSQPINTLPERARLITPAVLPASPSRPNIPLNVAAGLLVGLVLGFLTALVRDRLDDRVRGAGELEQRGLAVLAVVPRSQEPAPAPDVLVVRAPDSPAAQAYGSLSEQVLVGTGTVPAVVVVTSAVQEEGTSSVSANLAAAVALSGRQVAVVDADARPSRGQPAGLKDWPGLLDVLSHRAPLPAALQPTRVPRLKLLAVGHRTAGSPAQLVGSRWAEISAALARSFDLVVVAAAPILASADGLRAAHGADGVVVVVHDRLSSRSDLDRVVMELGRVQAPVLGCVLIERARSWGRLRRPLRHLRRGPKAQRRADHPDDYARQLSPGIPPEPPSVDQPSSAEVRAEAETVPQAEAAAGQPNGAVPQPQGDVRQPHVHVPEAHENGQGQLDADMLREGGRER